MLKLERDWVQQEVEASSDLDTLKDRICWADLHERREVI